MTRKTANVVAGTLVALGTLGAPTIASAQRYGYVNDDQPSVVVECGPGQRAVMEQTRSNGRTQIDGNHVNRIAERMRVLPFFAANLASQSDRR